MIRRKIKFDSKSEPDIEVEDIKIRRRKKAAIVVAFLSTYLFYIKLLFF